MKRSLLIVLSFALCFAYSDPTAESVATIMNHSTLWKAFNRTYQERNSQSGPKTIMLPMRDGVRLNTAYWSGSSGAPASTVLVRTPYGVNSSANIEGLYAPFGFAVVLQDQRGTGQSEGNWTFWKTAAYDGFDTLQWIAEQPWSNGKVYQMGESAPGILTYLDMKLPQPHMHGQFILLANSVLYFTVYQGQGAYKKSIVHNWLGAMHRYRPNAPDYETVVLQQEGYSDWWAQDMLTDLSNVKFKTIQVAGWYDIFLGPMIKSFNNYDQLSDPSVRGKQQLIIGPVGHCQARAGDYPGGSNDFVWGYQISLQIFTEGTEIGEKINNIIEANAPKLDKITAYIIGANPHYLTDEEKQHKLESPQDYIGMYWTTLSTWPTPTPVTYYLSDQKTLSPNPISSKTALSFVYNPANPVPTVGGNNLFLPCGALDQRPVENRTDVLIFTSAPISAPVAIFGSFKVSLTVASNCTDTDFTVKVTDVYPGTQASILVTDDLLRMRWRDDLSKVSPMEPNKEYTIEIETWPMAYVFATGHQIRLAVSSSNYPRFSATPNNGKMVIEGGPLLTARNTVIVGDGSGGSSISIPIVPLSAIPNNVSA